MVWYVHELFRIDKYELENVNVVWLCTERIKMNWIEHV